MHHDFDCFVGGACVSLRLIYLKSAGPHLYIYYMYKVSMFVLALLMLIFIMDWAEHGLVDRDTST